jgi:hypothetical protein
VFAPDAARVIARYPSSFLPFGADVFGPRLRRAPTAFDEPDVSELSRDHRRRLLAVEDADGVLALCTLPEIAAGAESSELLGPASSGRGYPGSLRLRQVR